MEFLRKEDTLSPEGAMVELRLVRSLIMLNSGLMLAAQAGGEVSEARMREAQRESS